MADVADDQQSMVPVELEGLRSQREGLMEQLAGHTQEASQLDQRRRELVAQSEALAEMVCGLAREEAELQRRKETLQQEVQTLGGHKKSYLKNWDQVESQIRTVQERVDQIDLDMRRHNRSSPPQRERRVTPLGLVALGAQASLAGSAPDAETRESARGEVVVEVGISSHHCFFPGVTQNLSDGGIFIATHEALPVGTEVEITINFPDQPPLRSQCVVRWIRSEGEGADDLAPGMGVQFLELDPQQTEQIRVFLQLAHVSVA